MFNNSNLSSDLDASTLRCVLGKPSISEDFYFMEHYQNLSLKNIQEEFEGVLYTEKWKPIKGYEKYYLISNFGRVKSLCNKSLIFKREKILKQSAQPTGYLFVSLFDRKGNHQLINTHRLVGVAFINNSQNKPEVNHKHGIKIDNRAHQLEWNTISENRKHAYATGLNTGWTNSMTGKFGKLHHNSKPVNQYDLEGNLVATFEGTRDAFRKTGILQISISRAARGVVKSAGGYKWEYHK